MLACPYRTSRGIVSFSRMIFVAVLHLRLLSFSVGEPKSRKPVSPSLHGLAKRPLERTTSSDASLNNKIGLGDAERELKLSLELLPAQLDVRSELGQVYMRLRRYDLAEMNLKKF